VRDVEEIVSAWDLPFFDRCEVFISTPAQMSHTSA
jgi:hypothetical protein